MMTLARRIITETAVKAGIPESNIIDIAPDSITLPKPRLDIQFLPETAIKTGRKLAETRNADGVNNILSLYEVRLSVACNIYTSTVDELEKLSGAFIKALPRKFADAENNIVKLWFASGQWKATGGTQIGLKKIEPIKTRSRLIRIDFIYHVTTDRLTPYLKDFEFKHEVQYGKEQ